MNALSIIDLTILLLKGLLKGSSDSAPYSEASDALAGIEEAIAKLESVRGTEVTKSQLDALRIAELW